MSDVELDDQERYEDDLQDAAVVFDRYLDLWRQIFRPRLYERPVLVDRSVAVETVESWERGHPDVCWDAIGMTFPIFHRLCTELETFRLVTSTRHLPAKVKIGVTLWMLRHGGHVREMRLIFQLSLRTLS